MNEKEFNGLILAELVKIANDVFTNEIEIAVSYTHLTLPTNREV